MTLLTLSEYEELKELVGLTVGKFAIGKDDSGYDFIRIEFTDGTVFDAIEQGQCGSIGWFVSAYRGTSQ